MKYVLILTLSVALPTCAQTPKCSARAIFIGENGAMPPASCEAAKPPAPVVPKSRVSTGHGPRNGPAKQHDSPIEPVSLNTPMSAMMYWIELVNPGGEMQRVTTDRVFHTGEQIRIHFQSSVPGRLTIAQLRPDGASQLLFPDPRINAGDAIIEAKADTSIPSWGHFRFDNETGTERLLVVLNPSGMNGPAENQYKAGAVLDTGQTAQLAQNVSTKRGLFFEADDAPANKAVYIAAGGNIAVEIRLKHQ